MLQINRRVDIENTALDTTLSLPFHLRQKCRLRVELDNGQQAGVVLPRGTLLKAGDVLLADSGERIGVCAQAEDVTTVFCDNAWLFARACYHLGNRHVPLQIGEGWLRYGRDHVLDDMLMGLGLSVSHASLPFEPESGAYHSHGN